MTIGQQIRQRRKQLGLTQVELAERLNMNQADISRIELDKHAISTRKLQAIASVIGVEIRLVTVSNYEQ